ncbi:twin-arginine translocase TatA/TatE family subunit [Pseudomonas sp. RIT-PI-AD]|uniref:twin-arginine translocase TatA/TatE family subunit n=1 Tax=Pseudomonas sp. RIT-PI-AD TaxID=3035294 RepID=UPI0021DA72D9|nr:twin-arginine translocase TatA/TatE family subunit [Pseudomonas sp. RIT-PI-AD]
MGIFDWKHWLILLVVVVLVFGTKKLKNFGSDLGESIKGFRKAMNSEEDEVKPQPPVTPPPSQPLNPPHTLDAQAHQVDEPVRRD